MSDIHSCGYFCQIPACVLQQRDAFRDKLQTSESNGPLAAAPQAVEAMSDAYIESLVRKHGGKWGGSYWVFEDADLHPFVRTVLTRASHTQAVPQTLDVMSDEPYNGEGWELLAMALAAEEHDDIHRLIWCGGPIPEPWGEVWEQYEDEAKRMIELVKKHAGPALSSHTAPAEPSVTPVQAWMRVDNVMDVSTGPNAYKDPMRAQVYLATGKEAAPAEPLLSKAAKDIIGQWLNDDMDTAIRNGANSISMPGELVEIAAWLCKVAPAVAVPVGCKLVPIAMSEQNTQLLRHSLHQITAGDFEPTLQEVAEIYAAATGLEAIQPELTVPKGVKSVLICPRCKVDRFSADCPSRIGCPMDAQAQLTLKATSKDKP